MRYWADGTTIGRLMAFRTAGSGLIFLDIFQDGYMVQGICNQDKIDAFGWITKKLFKDFCHKLQRGDFICWFSSPVFSCFPLIYPSHVWPSTRN